MDTEQTILTRALTGICHPSGYRWEDLMGDMCSVISSPQSEESELLLLSILRFEGRLDLDPVSEFPHSMSPEDMLKSLAVQALAMWTGARYLAEMRQLESTSLPPLNGLIRAVLRRVTDPVNIA